MPVSFPLRRELAIRRKERGRLESGLDWENVKFPQTPFFRRSSP
jgi:hypothetical protein